MTVTKSKFKAKLLRPAKPGRDELWSFLILPKAASEKLPRRGRTTVDVSVNGHGFEATLEPDGQLSHWLLISARQMEAASAGWEGTTTIARLDWIHWITSAKQAKTRAKRINDAREMLASGKARVCCFDQSGFYSKSFSAPQAVD